MDYAGFLEHKAQIGGMSGFEPISMPSCLFDFQHFLTEWSIRKGKSAMFADCGMGKSLCQLVWADNVVRHTNRPVLILTPLAVSHQTCQEAEKFGIEARRSRDGKVGKPSIYVTNYEQLHQFDPADFAGCVADECFAPETVVDMADGGRKYIKDVREGDTIKSAAGIDLVADVHRREVPYAVRVTFRGETVTCSPNHPWLTLRGWVGAQDLTPTDRLVSHSTAVLLVRSGIHSEISRSREAEVLREILLSEMADDTAGDFGEGSYFGSPRTDRKEEERLASWWKSGGSQGTRPHHGTQPNIRPRGASEDLPPIERDEARTFRAWGQWEASSVAAAVADGCAGRRMGAGVCLLTGPTNSRVSLELQDRHRERQSQNRHRSGWSLPRGGSEEGTGPEEGSEAGFIRLDGLEVLEPGHPDLERYRSADGRIYFYDLGATRHPSFSVNGALVHNSSILKSYDGARKKQIVWFMRKLEYRLLCTATAAPNDYHELGTSSEALGELGYKDMLSRFFKNDQNNQIKQRTFMGGRLSRAVTDETAKWRLKGHAEEAFWRWVCSWARAIRKPSDFGFDDGAFLLPALIEREHVVTAKTLPAGCLFAMPAFGLKEQREERRRTIRERCEKAAELVAHSGQPALMWCHLNAEGDLLSSLVKDGLQIAGADSDEAKEEKFEAFTSGQLRVLITKPKIGAWGLNFQHCAHMTAFPSHSFEQYYQCIRRCLRFGQLRNVEVDMVTTEGELDVIKNLQRKAVQADKMFDALMTHMNSALAIERMNAHTTQEILPSWL